MHQSGVRADGLLRAAACAAGRHLGYRSEELTPTRRGFETWVGYYWHGENYFTHVRDSDCDSPGVDFSNASASDRGSAVWPLGSDNGTYSAYIFAAEAQRVIRLHAREHSQQALYLYVPMQNVHAPIEVPARFEALYDGAIQDPHRKTFAGMVSALVCTDFECRLTTRWTD